MQFRWLLLIKRIRLGIRGNREAVVFLTECWFLMFDDDDPVVPKYGKLRAYKKEYY